MGFLVLSVNYTALIIQVAQRVNLCAAFTFFESRTNNEQDIYLNPPPTRQNQKV